MCRSEHRGIILQYWWGRCHCALCLAPVPAKPLFCCNCGVPVMDSIYPGVQYLYTEAAYCPACTFLINLERQAREQIKPGGQYSSNQQNVPGRIRKPKTRKVVLVACREAEDRPSS